MISRRIVYRSSSIEWTAHRCQRVFAGCSASRCSNQSIVEPLAEEEEAAGDLEHRAPRRPCHRDDVRPVHQLVLERVSPAQARRARPRRSVVSASRSRCSRHASGPICSITEDSSRKADLACSTASPSRRSGARTRYHRAVDSTSRSTAVISSFWIPGSILPSRDSMSSHRDTASTTSRAILNARTTSAGVAPVSATSRETNVTPCEFTTSFDTIVAISSRRSGCSPSSRSEPLDDLLREVPRRGHARGTANREGRHPAGHA